MVKQRMSNGIALCALLSVAVSCNFQSVMSLMYAVLLFINASVVLLVLGFEFLAFVNLLVYVGALAVLFLFVIMLVEIPATELRAYARGWSTLGIILLGCGRLTGHLKECMPAMESISCLGEALYINYADILILNSLVLTIALFGALVLAF